MARKPPVKIGSLRRINYKSVISALRRMLIKSFFLAIG